MDIFFDYRATRGVKRGRIEAVEKDLCVFHQPTHVGENAYYLQGVTITFTHDDIQIRGKCVNYKSSAGAQPPHLPMDILIVFTANRLWIGPDSRFRWGGKGYPLADTTDFTHLKMMITVWSSLSHAANLPHGASDDVALGDSRQAFVKRRGLL